MKNKMKRNRRNSKTLVLIGIVLILVGLIIFLIPRFNSAIIKHNQQKASTNELSADKIKQNKDSKASFDFEKVNNISTTGTWGNIDKYNVENIIGQIVIPNRHINLTLFKGVDEANLVAGAGTMKADQEMGKGNYTVAGHRALDSGVLFHELLDAKEGDEVRITDKENIYIYRIKETKITDPYALYMLDDERMAEYGEKPIITLMTCYKIAEDKFDRFFAVGTLEKTIPYTKEAMEKAQ